MFITTLLQLNLKNKLKWCYFWELNTFIDWPPSRVLYHTRPTIVPVTGLGGGVADSAELHLSINVLRVLMASILLLFHLKPWSLRSHGLSCILTTSWALPALPFKGVFWFLTPCLDFPSLGIWGICHYTLMFYQFIHKIKTHMLSGLETILKDIHNHPTTFQSRGHPAEAWIPPFSYKNLFCRKRI